MQINDYLYLVGSEQFALSHLLDCNCYLLDGGTDLALIDTGTGLGGPDILANIERHGFDPKRLTHIVVTHAHLGHWGAAGELRKKTGAQVLAPRACHQVMLDPKKDPLIAQNFKFGRYPKNLKPRPCKPDHLFGDNERINIGKIQLRTIHAPGHTKDSTCFYFEHQGMRGLFSADVVFYGGRLGLSNGEGCDFADYRQGIQRLRNLKIDLLLPGHGVFILKNGQKHIDRAIRKLEDFVMPETFFESNEFMWEKDYLSSMTAK